MPLLAQMGESREGREGDQGRAPFAAVFAAVPIHDGELYRTLAAIYKRSKVLSPAMKQLLALLKEGN